MENMIRPTTEAASYFEVAEGFILLENLEFPKEVASKDPTYLKHFKMARSLKNTTYYTIRKHCALTPFGPFFTAAALDACMDEMQSIIGTDGAVDVLNRMAEQQGIDIRVGITIIHARVDSEQEPLRQRLRRFTVETLSDMKAELLGGRVAQLTHRASPFNNLDLYCKGDFASILRAVYSSEKDQIAQLRQSIASGATEEEAGAKVDTRVIDEAIDLFRRAQ